MYKKRGKKVVDMVKMGQQKLHESYIVNYLRKLVVIAIVFDLILKISKI